jgi:hypothetical protein
MSASFDTSESRLVMPGGTKLDDLPTLTNGFSVTFWFYRYGNNTDGFTVGFIHWKGDEGSAEGWRTFIFDAAGSGATPDAFGYLEHPQATSRRRDTASGVLTGNNIWHFVALTVLPGNAASDVHWYIALPSDNVVTETSYSLTTNGSGSYTSDAARNFYFGYPDVIGSEWSFYGRLAENQIFDHALTPNEINAVFRSSKILGMIHHAPLWGLHGTTPFEPANPDPDLTQDHINPQNAGFVPTKGDHAPVGPYVMYAG